jgi:hypothetical protein
VLCSESAAEAGRSVRAGSSRSHHGVCLHISQGPVCRQRVPAATAVTHGSRYGTRRPQVTRVPGHDIVSCACDALTSPEEPGSHRFAFRVRHGAPGALPPGRYETGRIDFNPALQRPRSGRTLEPRYGPAGIPVMEPRPRA